MERRSHFIALSQGEVLFKFSLVRFGKVWNRSELRLTMSSCINCYMSSSERSPSSGVLYEPVKFWLPVSASVVTLPVTITNFLIGPPVKSLMEIKVHAQAVTSLFDYIRGPPTTHAPVAVRIFINKRINYLLGSYFQSRNVDTGHNEMGLKFHLLIT